MKRHPLTAPQALAAMLTMIGLVAAAPYPIVKAIVITGDPALPVPAIVAHLTARLGMRYSDAIGEKDAHALRDFYAAHDLEIGRIQGGIDPASIDAKSDTATLKYAIYAARIAQVRIAGDTNVNEAMVRKLLAVRPGMLVNPKLVKADYQRLRATGKFRRINVDIVPGPDPKNPQDVTLVWTLVSR
jgi:outer membrane protein assembly factor BamA